MRTGRAQGERLTFLSRIVEREARLLRQTSERLFREDIAVTAQDIQSWIEDIEMSERLDAFVVRFGRLQDTLGDKLIPALLGYLGESLGPVVDNLDKAERFGWIESAQAWIMYRKLRNQMVHEYIEDPAVLADALDAGRRYVGPLIEMSQTITEKVTERLNQAPAGA